MSRPLRRIGLALLVTALATWTSGCSLRRFALARVADALVAGGEVFASDEDPELVRDAAPFALKTLESLLAELPEHRGLLLGACRGFTQYAWAFVETDAKLIEAEDWPAAERLRARAIRLYLRARRYGLRALELKHRDLERRLMVEPGSALTDTGARELELLYWTGASWGAAIALGKDRPELVADLPAVLELMRRALELDETYRDGALHEVMIALESLPANMGGSLERAREHFDRAVALSGGKRAGPFVSWAVNVSVAEQDREEFERLLQRALEVDADARPASRLETLIVQRRARHLLERADDLFLEDEGGP